MQVGAETVSHRWEEPVGQVEGRQILKPDQQGLRTHSRLFLSNTFTRPRLVWLVLRFIDALSCVYMLLSIVKRKKKVRGSDSTLCATERRGLCRSPTLSLQPVSVPLKQQDAVKVDRGRFGLLFCAITSDLRRSARLLHGDVRPGALLRTRAHPKKINGGIVRRAGPGRTFLLNSILWSPSTRQNEWIYTSACCCGLCHGVRKQVNDSKTETDLQR